MNDMTGRLWVAGIAAAAMLACSSGSDSTTGPASGDITVGNNFFSPKSFSVAAGGTVTWTWNPGGVDHTVTFDDGSTSSSAQSSGTFTRTFATAGTFTYHCMFHVAQGMVGTIVVGGSSGGSSGGGGGGTGGGGGGTGGGGGYGGM
jgi:plastocyanin